MDVASVLVPIDLTEDSTPGLAVASEMAGTTGARLVLLHVLDMSLQDWDYSEGAADLATSPAQRQRDAEQEMMALVNALPSPPNAVEYHVRFGGVCERILELAERLPADLIVMGARGAPGLVQFQREGATVRVMRRARCPVLVLGPHLTSCFGRDFWQSSVRTI